MIVLCSLMLALAGPVLIYLASAQQRLRAKPLPASARWLGWLLMLVATAGWIDVAGMGAGITAALTAVMLAWVALPYLAWWRTGRDAAKP